MAADGSIVIDVDLDNKKAQQELNKLNKKIESLNDQIYIKQQQQMPLIEQSKQLGAELDLSLIHIYLEKWVRVADKAVKNDL